MTAPLRRGGAVVVCLARVHCGQLTGAIEVRRFGGGLVGPLRFCSGSGRKENWGHSAKGSLLLHIFFESNLK